MRNFWLSAKIDGYKNELSGGPKSFLGNLEATISQRSKGESVSVLHIEGFSHISGELVLTVENLQTGEIWKIRTNV